MENFCEHYSLMIAVYGLDAKHGYGSPVLESLLKHAFLITEGMVVPKNTSTRVGWDVN